MTLEYDVLSFENKISDYNGLMTTPWARLSDQPGQNPREANIVVCSNRTFQQFQGTGAAFSEIGGKALGQLDKISRNQVLRRLFDRETGAGFCNCRLPVGSSDFALSAYSLNDHKDDFEMKHFSLDRDWQYLIPFIKWANDYAEDLRIHCSPWSPPAWMKTNGSFVEGGSLIDKPQIYKAYAKYLIRFVKEYCEAGINIDKLLIQNEPDSASNFPTCVMPPRQMAVFVAEYLRPAIKEAGIDVQIWAGTFRTITGFQAREFMECQGAEAVDGVGFQYALAEHMIDFSRQFPKVRMMHTETPCYRGENTWKQAIGLFNTFVDYMNAGCEIFSYWNMVLDEKSESTWGWKQNSLVTIKDNGDVVMNPDFYVMEIISKHIRPGAKRVECLCLTKQTIGFRNVDGSVVVYACNLNDKKTEANMSLDGETYKLVLEASTITAVTIF